MAKATDELTIDNWQTGIAPSPLQGFGMFRNIDSFTNPGSIRLNNLSTERSAGTITNYIIGFRRDPNPATNNGQDIWAYDHGGTVYHSTNNGGNWSVVAGNSAGTGMGIAIWKDYLFVATATKLDTYGPLSSSPAWSGGGAKGVLNFQTLIDDAAYHTILESVDDKLYICNNRYVASLSELTTFNPNTLSTYTWTPKAITLGTYYRTKCLADLGANLMVGTMQGLNEVDYKIADIFPYTRVGLTLNIPLKLQKNGVNAMISVNNRLYIQAGVNGEIFVSDGVTFQQLTSMPNYVVSLDGGKSILARPSSIMWHKEKLFIGFIQGAVGSYGNLGVYSYNPDKNTLVLENTISTGNDGTTNELDIFSLYSISRDQYLIGWLDNTTSGIDLIDNTLRVTNYGGYVDTALFQVGEALGNRTFSQLEVYLSKPLANGQGVRIQYRKDLVSAFATLATIDYATYSGSSNLQAINVSAAVITSAVFLQLRILLTTGSSNTSPEVTKVMLKMSI